MNRIIPWLAALLVACSAAQAQTPRPAAVVVDVAADDLREINGIFEQWQNAWNTHDMRAFVELFHEDGTWIVWTGRVWRGRKAIEDGHVEAHRTFFRNSTQFSHPEEIRQVAPGVVVARSRTTLPGDTRDPNATIIGLKLLVLTKRGGAWKILYGQNTRQSAAVAAAP